MIYGRAKPVYPGKTIYLHVSGFAAQAYAIRDFLLPIVMSKHQKEGTRIVSLQLRH